MPDNVRRWGILLLILVGLSRSFFFLGELFGAYPCACAFYPRNLLPAPFPQVFDAPKYFGTFEMELRAVDGRSLTMHPRDFAPYFRGPWHWQTLIRHGISFRGNDWGVFEAYAKKYLCTKVIFGDEDPIPFPIERIEYRRTFHDESRFPPTFIEVKCNS